MRPTPTPCKGRVRSGILASKMGDIFHSKSSSPTNRRVTSENLYVDGCKHHFRCGCYATRETPREHHLTHTWYRFAAVNGCHHQHRVRDVLGINIGGASVGSKPGKIIFEKIIFVLKLAFFDGPPLAKPYI